MKYIAKRILLALIALSPFALYADQLEVTFPRAPALDVNGLPAQVLSWDVYVNGALREEGVPLSVSSRTYEITEFRQYSVQVAAINSVGVGALSAAVTVDYNQPRGVPERAGAPGVRILMVGGGGGQPPSGGGGNEGGNEGDNADRIAVILNGRTPHFTPTYPADPETTREVTVTTALQFNNEARVDGTKITIGNSFSGSITIAGSDIDVVMDNAYTIAGNTTIGNPSYSERVRWTGGNLDGTFVLARGRDILFDDVFFDVPGQGGGAAPFALALGNTQDRVAFLNTTVDVVGGSSAGDWAMFVQANGGVDGLTLLNTKLMSDGQNNRFQNCTDVVIADSVFNPDGGSANGMRFHYSTTDVWVKDSWSRGLMKLDAAGSETEPSILNALFDNFDRYYTSWAFQGSKANTGTVQNSTLYGGTISFSPLSDGGGNASDSWDGSTVPDYSAIGAIR